jgi:hypothetical protein
MPKPIIENTLFYGDNSFSFHCSLEAKLGKVQLPVLLNLIFSLQKAQIMSIMDV